MSMNMQQRREMDKMRAIQESKMTASSISTKLFVLFGLWITSIIISLVSNKTSSPVDVLSSSWFSIIISFVIGIVTIITPDYDGGFKRAGGCYLAGTGLAFFSVLLAKDINSISFLILLLVIEVILIVIYYLSFCFEMRDRLSSISTAAGAVWKVVGIIVAISYIVLLCLLLYAFTAENNISYRAAKTFVDICKIDAYTIIISQISYIIMILVTAIMLQQYANSPITSPTQPSYPPTGMQTPYGAYPMQSPYGQPGMSPQGQPYAPQGQAYIQAQPYAPQGQAYTQPGQPYPQPYAQPGMPQPYAAAPMVPQPYAANPTLFHNIATSREPSANEWKCSCGLINPNYTGTCACGQKKNSPTRRPPNMSGASAGSPAQPAAAGVPSNEVDKIKLIKEYKQLLDSGIISQEEFDAKKRELLR